MSNFISMIHMTTAWQRVDVVKTSPGLYCRTQFGQ